MLYLRAVRNYKKFRPGTFDLSDAVKGLTDSIDRLSVYRVENCQEADRIITLYAMSGKDQPEQVDYILIPDGALIALGIAPAPIPGDINHAFLTSRHYEITGLTDQATRGALAVAIRDHAETAGKRLRPRAGPGENDLQRQAMAEIQDPIHGPRARALIEARPKWLQLVGIQ